ncbi:MAG: hypothetical protein JF612_04235 [Planctomycetia bacterium]|nr:hypothetical protein [Planctomycetia bacterium]
MTGLLVSVRSAAEAETALAGGADIIDVKEPRRGALGPADPIVWKEILAVIGRRVPVSAALGELHSGAIREYASSAAGFAYAKIGLSDWCRRPDSPSKWFQARLAMPRDVCAVQVVYADLEASGWKTFAAAMLASIALAAASQSPLIVIDTFRKDRRTLLDLVEIQVLQEWIHHAAHYEVRLVLAGSLNEQAKLICPVSSPSQNLFIASAEKSPLDA